MKKSVSFILALIMVVSIIPISAFFVAAKDKAPSIPMEQYRSKLYKYSLIENSKLVITAESSQKWKYGTISFSTNGFQLSPTSEDIDNGCYLFWDDEINQIKGRETLCYKIFGKNNDIIQLSVKKHNSNVFLGIFGKVHYDGKASLTNITKIDTFCHPQHSNYVLNFDLTFSNFVNKYDLVAFEDEGRVYFKPSQSLLNKAGGNLSYLNNKKTGVQKTNTTITVKASPKTSGVTLATIPANQLFVVTEVADGFGKVTYNGTTGWVNLNYCTYVEPIVTKPVAPTVTLKTAQDIPITGLATVEWNSVYDAKYYSAVVYDQGGTEKQRIDNIYGTTASFCLSDPGDYTIKVYGQNSLYTGDPGTANSVVHVHANSTVTYYDEDGTTLIGSVDRGNPGIRKT